MTYLLGLQPVIVPAGRMSLGRIFNVVGAIIDRYLGLSLSYEQIINLFWYATTTHQLWNDLHIDWLFYTCNLYLGLNQLFSTPMSIAALITMNTASLSLGCALHYLTTVLSRGLASKGIYPAVDPFYSTSKMSNTNVTAI